jgi:REP element-mobilizing transposase RayT
MRSQLSFLRQLKSAPPRTEHGGDVRRRRRKLSRPIDSRRPLHVVLRASRAHGTWSLLRSKNKHFVQHTMRRFARRFGIRIYEFANAGNHVHLLLRTKCRFAIQNFLRAFAGLIARFVTGACKGFRIGKFWDELAYSRIVTWGRDFIRVRSYVVQNEFEGLGYPYAKRSREREGSIALPRRE